MSLVVIGLSHRTAPLDVLESVVLTPAQADAVGRALVCGDHVREAVVVGTCNRLEVYAEAATFHGAIDEVVAALREAVGVDVAGLRDHLYVHYEDRAIAHTFSVACGLESMAVGEPQILGQLRTALDRARGVGTVGTSLNLLFQQALRVGKRAHSETGLDRAGASLVGEGLDVAAEVLGGLSDARVLVLGAGSMSALAATTVARRGPAHLDIVNRTRGKAERLAASLDAGVREWDDLPAALADADVVVTCTGAVGHVVSTDLAGAALAARRAEGVGGPQVYVDLALPRDVDPPVAALPGAHVVDLEAIGARLSTRDGGSAVAAVRDLVTAEVAAFLVTARAQQVAPTVAALRSRAAAVVGDELDRLDRRLPELDPASREEVSRAVRRIVDKLLHTPTVRVKELAGRDQTGDYAQVLRELFDLDSRDVAAVSTPPNRGGTT